MARQSRVSRVLVAGPLAPFADAYREALEGLGYTGLSAVNLQRQAAHLSRWLDAQSLSVEQLDEACIEAFLADQRATGRAATLSRPGLSCLLELLRDRGVVGAAPPPAPSPTEELMDSFRRYMLAERGLVPATVRGAAMEPGPEGPVTTPVTPEEARVALPQWSRGPKAPVTHGVVAGPHVVEGAAMEPGPEGPGDVLRLRRARRRRHAAMEPGPEGPGDSTYPSPPPPPASRRNGAGARRPR